MSPEEKAYCRGLEALRQKDYPAADKEFETCREQYGQSQGFMIIAEATHLLMRLRQEKQQTEIKKNEIKENSSHGEETIVCGQSLQEESDKHMPGMQY
ncbi:MAG: hypothetical protein GY841_01160 [FCB group bacterium]|nr:hypothetical protein [FCB group bacterium]